MNYIPREIEKELKKISAQFPVTLLTGPRQTGKSTMLMHLFPKYHYITFDDSSLRLSARKDPAAFVEILQTPVIIDEIQYAPEILPFIKIHVGSNRQNGRYILTGSQVFNLMAGVTESLAGRTCLFELLPFSFKELTQIEKSDIKPKDIAGCLKQIIRGFYPIPNIEKTDIKAFYGAYLSLYIERDVRQIQNIKDASIFEVFLQILASRAGNLLNIADLAQGCSISQATCKTWLSILENSRIIYLLRPWFRNSTKRLIKSPKVYFTDTGLLAYLLKYSDFQTLQAGPAMGSIFENMIIVEFLKKKINNRLNSDLYFYRDSNGVEVDLVIDEGFSISLYEIKASKTLRSDMTKAFKSMDISGCFGKNADIKKQIISFHENRIPLEGNIIALPWWDV
ncbi:MAG: ATP-binding protein [Spirochaetes bacterium]|nr:ATP-binding protein [Spirochaetota bacterium]